MATLTNRDGSRFIQFGRGRARRTITLGKMGDKPASTIRSHVEHLLSAKASAMPLPEATALWLGKIDDSLHAKLAKVDLVAPREHDLHRLGAMMDAYIARRTDLKGRTVLNLKQTRGYLAEFFGADRDIRTISRAEAKDWRRKLAADLAEATVAMHVKKARQFFADAVDRRLLVESPFAKLKAGSQVNDARKVYVPSADVLAAIAKCPDAEWRLIFALSRFGGLRVPSETHGLLWSDVDWARGRMLVRSPKTEHHQGGESRTVPIFPELLPWLREAFEAAEPGAKHAIAKHRGDNVSTTGVKIARRAGLAVWERFYQNLRASCETDLTARFPLHVVCTWIGNSEQVARLHYLQVTDQHFADAADPKALHNALRTAADTSRQPSHAAPKTAITAENRPNHYPQGGYNSDANPRVNLALSIKAQRKALHRLQVAIPHIRERDIALLTQELDAARRQGKAVRHV